ncbi:hypothetical protein BDW72DRAFT_178831 [Aspergillus terricola var. indicus]
MAAAAQPSGLMDIASSLTQDEIPFKLRCAICNKLALNAFRLPCCDQAICENCQASLPDTCPVCAHTPISSDLCKPNKALRTTLKAFLRTEEKKREKERQERQEAQPATSDEAAPALAEEASVRQESQQDSNVVEETPADGLLPNPAEDSSAAQPVDTAPLAAEVDAPGEEQVGTNGVSQIDEQPETVAPDAADRALDVAQKNAEGDNIENNESTGQPDQDSQNAMPGSGFSNPMGFNMNPGMFPNMAWGTNPMAQFMGGGMMGFPNPMGMAAMGMDPMAASQGIFGGYGMNMNGMSNGMNMGMSFNAGQGMYGGWDGSQNNMWNGSQDKFNPNAFANGMGAQFGDPSGFGGYNMSQPNGVHPQMQQQQFSNQELQNGYYGPGNYRGRGRGYYSGGRGRGGYIGHMQPNFPHNVNSAALQDNTSSADQIMPSQTEEGAADATATEDNVPSDGKNAEDGPNPASASSVNQALNEVEANGGNAESVPGADGHPDQAMNAENQLQGIPTVDSLNEPYNVGAIAAPTYMHQGFGRGGGYMRGGFHGRGGSLGGQQQYMPAPNMQPRGPGVEGAPAAPRAMRQGLPNTSVFRQRNFHLVGRGSNQPSRGPEASDIPHAEPTSEDQRPQSSSRSISRARSRSKSKPSGRSRSRSRVPSRSSSRRRYRARSRSIEDDATDYDRQRERRRRPHHDERDRTADDERRTRSPSIESHRSSLRDKERDRRRSRRSRRSHRRRSRSRSASGDRNGDSRDTDRFAEERSSPKPRSRNADTLDTHRSGKDRSSRREEERERDRDSRRRDRERDRDRDRIREKERERDRERERPRDRDRDRDRKRSRRDRSESAPDSDYHSRKAKRGREDDARTSTSNRDRPKDAREKTHLSNPPEPEKDPHTLEREARNRERLLKEQQRREAMQADRDTGKSSRRRDSRQERAGRRLNYKYDDETDAARAARVEREREAGRWE